MQDFEKLGVFYLGRPYDLQQKQTTDGLVLYDSKDLLTHAVCIGMTGSGKTGLCLSLLEEAAIDSVPVIAIDPKGDISNLLLTFPDLQGKDFEPWINADDARRAGVSTEQFAEDQAAVWKKGLADWGQDGDRIRRLREAADFQIYTPGSTAGLQVSVLQSFDVPPPAVLEDSDLLRERITSTAAGILTLLNIEADPLKSREHILVSNILTHSWKAGVSLDLHGLIQQIQLPPFTQIGALSLESFYPAKERFELAMSLNNLLAAPGFDSWLKGSPLDIDQVLYSKDGKPRVSIFSIAHLSDTERMFFVSLLLNQVLSWMRAQSGTTSLRAILYMDEIFGYFPPTANPPSKQPLLTLLKQARAFGLGVVLATQNPVDLDYKGLSNAGTWFIGRLQTERDKARLLEGLEGVAAGSGTRFDRQTMETLLAGLGSRVFLMNNVHDDSPVVFKTRWSMAYLRGPLSRDQIKRLMSEQRQSGSGSLSEPKGSPDANATPPEAVAAPVSARTASQPSSRPLIPPGVTEFFMPVTRAAEKVIYRPMVLGSASVRFVDVKRSVDVNRKLSALAVIDESLPLPVHWEKSSKVTLDIQKLERDPKPAASFAPLPEPATVVKNYTQWSKDFADYLAASKALEVFESPSTGESSKPGESERDFRIRLQQIAREKRDAAAAKLRTKYAPKIATLNEKLMRAQEEQDHQAQAARQIQMDAAIEVGATLLGSFMGRRGVSASRASTAARRASRAMQTGQTGSRIEDRIAALNEQLNELESEFKSEMAALESLYNPANEKLQSILIKTKKTNVSVQLLSLVWLPESVDAAGKTVPVWG